MSATRFPRAQGLLASSPFVIRACRRRLADLDLLRGATARHHSSKPARDLLTPRGQRLSTTA